MLLENIPLGKTLEIFVEREDYRYRLVSKVEDTNEKRVCVTAISSRNGKIFSFLPEDKISVLYRDPETMWEWNHVTAGLATLEGATVHYFLIADKGQSSNRRNAYRVNLLEDIIVNFYSAPGSLAKYAEETEFLENSGKFSEKEKQQFTESLTLHNVNGMIKNVSETGVGIYCDEEFAINDSIFFDIPCPYGDLHIKALIVRKTKIVSATSRFEYYYGCVIVKAGRKLLRYIYDLQREHLKKQKAQREDRGK